MARKLLVACKCGVTLSVIDKRRNAMDENGKYGGAIIDMNYCVSSSSFFFWLLFCTSLAESHGNEQMRAELSIRRRRKNKENRDRAEGRSGFAACAVLLLVLLLPAIDYRISAQAAVITRTRSKPRRTEHQVRASLSKKRPADSSYAYLGLPFSPAMLRPA